MGRPNPSVIIDDLLPQSDPETRKRAIRTFGKNLRRKDWFLPTWDAAGGIEGIAALMSEFSVRDVQAMCVWLGRTASAQHVRQERQERLEKLVRLLYDAPKDDRPLASFYQNIVPACSWEVVEEWENARGVQWTEAQERRLYVGHHDRFQQKYIQDIFSPDSRNTFREAKRRLRWDLALYQKTFSMLLDAQENIRIPRDFVSNIVVPLLKSHVDKKSYKAARNSQTSLLTRIFEKHLSILADSLQPYEKNITQHIVQLWIDQFSDKIEGVEASLVRWLEILPLDGQIWNLQTVYRYVCSVRQVKEEFEPKYQLFRLMLQHMNGYKLDIEDESDVGLARLRDLSSDRGAWPTEIFFRTKGEKGRALLRRLFKAQPKEEFLAALPRAGPYSVLNQVQSPILSGYMDIDIAIAELHNASGKGQEDQKLLDRVHALVKEHMLTSQQSRDSEERSFWARSALNLAVATRDLQLVRDVLLWTRRFIKDTITWIYSPATIGTDEFVGLLVWLSTANIKPTLQDTISATESSIRLGNRVLLDLMETAVMAAQEVEFARGDWTQVLRVSKAVTTARLEQIKSFKKALQTSFSHMEDLDATISEILWKPTINTLIEVEAMLRSPKSERLFLSSPHIEAPGILVMLKLEDVPPSILAGLLTFLQDTMKECLGADKARVHMAEIVTIINRLQKSNEPSAAIPFILDIMVENEDNSSVYRRLVSRKFLSSLPPAKAKEFIYAMATEIKERMWMQNAALQEKAEGVSVPDDTKPLVPKNPRPALVKMTSIKFIAGLLESNRCMSPSAICGILVDLLVETRHPDAQVSIVKGLLRTMDGAMCNEADRERILNAIETHVVPIAARVSQPTSDGEDKHPVPFVHGEMRLLMSLIEEASEGKFAQDDQGRTAKLIMKILQESAASNHQWMQQFVTFNNLGLEQGEVIPLAPASLSVFARAFISFPNYMLMPVFNMLRNMIFANLDPSPGISRITKALYEDPVVRSTNSGKHWLSQFHHPGQLCFQLGLNQAMGLLRTSEDDLVSRLPSGEGIDMRILQSFVLDSAKLLIKKRDFAMVEILVKTLCEFRSRERKLQETWRSNHFPVIKEIISAIENASETTMSASTKLHYAFKLRVMALAIPYWSEPLVDADMDDIVSETSRLINDLANRAITYHINYQELKKKLTADVDSRYTAIFAYRLLKVEDVAQSGTLTLADYLRLEVAFDVFSNRPKPLRRNKASVQKSEDDVRALIDAWGQSGNEGQREARSMFESRFGTR